jgi:hypothetical protein
VHYKGLAPLGRLVLKAVDFNGSAKPDFHGGKSWVSALWFLFAIAFLFTSLFATAVYATFVVAKVTDDFE